MRAGKGGGARIAPQCVKLTNYTHRKKKEKKREIRRGQRWKCDRMGKSDEE